MVHAQPSRPNRMAVPPGVEDYLAGSGMVGKWVSGNPNYLTIYTGTGWQVVLWDDLSEDQQRIARSHIDNPARSAGEIRRGDAILVASSSRNIQFWQEENANKNAQVMGEVPDLSFKANEIVEQAGYRGHAIDRSDHVETLPPSAHVVGGNHLDPALRSEMARLLAEDE